MVLNSIFTTYKQKKKKYSELTSISSSYHTIIGFFINVQVQGQHPHQWAPFQIASWLAACMEDLTPDLQVCLSWGLVAESFHSLQSLSVSCFHVILGPPGPCFPFISGAFSPSKWGPNPQCQAAQVAHWNWCYNVLQPDIAELFDHCSVIPLQTLEVWLCQWPSLTGMEHYPPHTRAVHTATCLEREVAYFFKLSWHQSENCQTIFEWHFQCCRMSFWFCNWYHLSLRLMMS